MGVGGGQREVGRTLIYRFHAGEVGVEGEGVEGVGIVAFVADDGVAAVVVEEGDGVGPDDECGFADEISVSDSVSVAEDTSFGSAVEVE